MSRDIQLQADMGALSLQGLGAFSSVLATLSADNVMPAALIQMERLGAAFPTNGKYAEATKSLLQRSSDVRFNHLAFVIGWRKNDTASLMAQSAGGQAISLLSMCLKSILLKTDAGICLSQLCIRLLPQSMNVSSVPQLFDVAIVLAGKLDTLGFGNLLAKEVTRIHEVYATMQRPAPTGLLIPLTVEFVLEMLQSISKAIREDQKVCRISGRHGMGCIVGLVQALFPRSLTLTIENIVVQDVDHPKIRCEIYCENPAESNVPTKISLETYVSGLDSSQFSVHLPDSLSGDLPYALNWSGWLANRLQLLFFEHDLNCDQSILDACGDVLVRLPARFTVDARPMLPLLGPAPMARMRKTCETILGNRFSEERMDLVTAHKNLVEVITAKLPDTCICNEGCSWSKAWPRPGGLRRSSIFGCETHQIWYEIGRILMSGLWSFFINAGPNAVVCPGRREIGESATYLREVFVEGKMIDITNVDLMQYVWHEATPAAPHRTNFDIVTCSESCAIYPAILQTFKMPSQQGVVFSLVEGRIVHSSRYHDRLEAHVSSMPRPPAKKSLSEGCITPSSIGAHDGDPLITIREAFDHLILRCSIRYDGIEREINLRSAILGYIKMHWASPCSHPLTDKMDLSKHIAIATSIASPAAVNGFGVAMTRWNSVAQFLCCEGFGYDAILQRNCCLNCAADSWKGNPGKVVIIVG